jgi:hypothetical protein
MPIVRKTYDTADTVTILERAKRAIARADRALLDRSKRVVARIEARIVVERAKQTIARVERMVASDRRAKQKLF